MLAYGEAVGDFRIENVTVLAGRGGDSALYGPIKTPIGFACACSWSTNFYVSAHPLFFVVFLFVKCVLTIYMYIQIQPVL